MFFIGYRDRIIFLAFSLQCFTIFSDSQMRPFVQGDLKDPPNWFLNRTPGGGFTHIRSEISNSEVRNPSHVIYLVGTNEVRTPIDKSY